MLERRPAPGKLPPISCESVKISSVVRQTCDGDGDIGDGPLSNAIIPGYPPACPPAGGFCAASCGTGGRSPERREARKPSVAGPDRFHGLWLMRA